MTSPTWMSLGLFEKALCEHFGRRINTLSFSSKPAVPVGDNYTSDMYRVMIKYTGNTTNKEETMSVVVKCAAHDGGAKDEFASGLNLFRIEMSVYQDILTKIHKILVDGPKLSAQHIYSTTKPVQLIILEDLKPLGFQMLGRQTGFDLEHCLMVMSKLAAFHAASVVAHEEDSSLISRYKDGLYADNKIINDFVNMGYESFLKSCAKWKGFGNYYNKLRNMGKEEFFKRGKESTKMGKFNVLNHGDLWINNMLFSHNPDGKLKDVRFVDFQMCIYTSPAIDLHYFLSTSPKVQIHMAYLNNILDYYYSQLLSNLSKLQYNLENVPTRTQFLADFNDRAFYGLLAATTVLPIVKSSGRPDASLEDLLKDETEEGFRHHCYNNKIFLMYIEHLLPYFDNCGILD